jgi:cytochrome c biogenesis factor
MIADFGFGILVISFSVALYGVGAAIFSALRGRRVWLESARWALFLTSPLIFLTILCLAILLLTDQYNINFVAETTNGSMPVVQKLSALWLYPSGLLIVFSWLIAIISTLVLLRNENRRPGFTVWIITINLLLLAFFLFPTILFENPFLRAWKTSENEIILSMFRPTGSFLVTPKDGSGLTPFLNQFAVFFHSPLLLVGFVLTIIPTSFGIATLAAGQSVRIWPIRSRSWILSAWLLLSLGLVLGMSLLYDVSPKGLIWDWDPVDTTALLVWLAISSIIHIVLFKERNGKVHSENKSLFSRIKTIPAEIWNHSTLKFLGENAWKPFLISLIVPVFLYFIGQYFWILDLAIWLAVWIILENLFNFLRKVQLQHHSSGESVRESIQIQASLNRWQYARLFIHMGMAMIIIGITGILAFQSGEKVNLQPGQSMILGNYHLIFQTLNTWNTTDSQNVSLVTISVTKNNNSQFNLYPHQDDYYAVQQNVTIPAIRRSIQEDLEIILVDGPFGISQTITLMIYRNPLITWVWIGIFLLILGGSLAFWHFQNTDEVVNGSLDTTLPVKLSAYFPGQRKD